MRLTARKDYTEISIPPVNPVHYKQPLFLQNLKMMITVNMQIYVKKHKCDNTNSVVDSS